MDEQSNKNRKIINLGKVAIKIFKLEEAGEQVWFSKLIELFSGDISRGDISEALNTLEDCFFVSSRYGKTRPGFVGKLFNLTEVGKSEMRKIEEECVQEA